MIIIDSKEMSDGYSVSILMKSNKLELTCEVKTFLERMLKEEPELINAVISELMPVITESTYNMDPDKYKMYSEVVEGML